MADTTGGQRFPSLHEGWDAAAVGNKFASLAHASRLFSVPAAIVVPVGEFRQAVPQAVRAGIQSVMNDLEATVGAYFHESVQRIAEIAADIRLPDAARRQLAERVDAVIGRSSVVAVRSSGLAEDGPANSLAGAYQSFLDVHGAEAVADAVERCWRSFYGPTAVAARIRAGDFTAEPALAVIIQQFVAATMSGVAFSGLDADAGAADITVEFVEGTAEDLVGGARSAQTVSDVSQEVVLGQVRRIAAALRVERGHEIDLEWAADRHGTIHVLQVRPLTARRFDSPDEIWLRRLYFAHPPANAQLGDVAAVYAGFEAKRGPANRLAAAHGVDVTTGWLMGFTTRALHRDHDAEAAERCLDTGRSQECLLDLGPALRQLVIPKTQLIPRLRDIHRADRHGDQAGAAVVRDYLRGELGFISHISGDRVVVEYAPEGLLALNRGTAGAERLSTDLSGSLINAPDSAQPLLAHLGRIATFTQAMSDEFGPAAVEWVLDGGVPVFLDYSLGLGTRHTAYSGTVISAGTARGPVLTVPDEELITRVSVAAAISIGGEAHAATAGYLADLLDRVRQCAQPPIILASRPYAALSMLIGSVAGFAFERGSVLSHLAILLRESGTPAVYGIAAGAVPDGTHAVISAGAFSASPAPPMHSDR
ncbi:PEP/pyruvate-binding domain-containing protein [Catellatospora tritici]|uniref:PEP/pyruvate-binding domain-containing protein n=1 Tax=Catellatospora tritici TaxID=2851566 RepID=UPI001C2D9D2A|nr:PEP/pyruvate-binding domain-containing protein [Catellatospora tritici]MBV1849561.1 deoxycytidine triphosphate deaminase [Catellatospora tritici]